MGPNSVLRYAFLLFLIAFVAILLDWLVAHKRR